MNNTSTSNESYSRNAYSEDPFPNISPNYSRYDMYDCDHQYAMLPDHYYEYEVPLYVVMVHVVSICNGAPKLM